MASASTPSVLGVVGAGTMGAGIAQLGCAAGMRTLLYDPVPEALEGGAARVRDGLRRWTERGRVGPEAERLLETVRALDELAPSELVIEAAPERFELKRELFERLSEACGAETVLASNTSSIPVTSLAGASRCPENVVGMHFFNPPPLMRLVEVIAADQSGERALEVANATGEAMGKRVIRAADGPGFLVNRCGRPFAAEALRLLQERVADHEQIDRICRLEGGFRMGPFELMDLVGIDVGLEVAKSFAELSFGEPRWQPSMLAARMVAAGRHGRKTGRGWYDYGADPYRPDDPEPLQPGGGDGRVVVIDGHGRLARELRERALAAGFDARGPGTLQRADPELLVDASVPADSGGAASGGLPVLVACADRSLAARGAPDAVGFHLLPPLSDVRLVELTRLPTTPERSAAAAERFFAALGLHREWVADAPGLVLGRIVCQLVNEVAFALGEGVGSAEDVDAGLELGLNHPRGAVAWAEAIGLDHVLAVIDGLYAERREERYRAAPLLRRATSLGRSLSG
ncbi:MAG TPA: 3-hydroxyacyl-CoA dehydrogenase NAD-binding domain-containing protein [Thermoleophilaceae bacterium]|nr:3-hydroxyacyl-CoA dehydrogenase NAD-binding domain-containing protein [Thermoleophilaceae bacterium]